MIYLDNAATSWPKPEPVYQAVDRCLREMAANPGRGSHRMARDAGMILYETREELAELFSIGDPNRISFTYNATDAMNMALAGLLPEGATIVTTAMEHNAVARPLRWLEKTRSIKIKIVPCDKLGYLDMESMLREISRRPAAVVMTHASNVSGAELPVGVIGRLTRQGGIMLIVDAAQTAGVENIDVEDMGIDVLTFSGHKGLLGPQGTGGIYIREGLDPVPSRFGGTGSLSESDRQPDFMPDSMESGTPNTPGIAGLRAGLSYIREMGRDKIKKIEMTHCQNLICGLKEIPAVRIIGPVSRENRTAVVSCIVDGWDSGEFARQLDQQFEIACRAGLHCAPWAHQSLGTIKTGAIRFSPGVFTTKAEIEAAVKAVSILAGKTGHK